jgi:peptidoglycan/LPS O-acetylase OafA/YrhL
LTASTSEGTVSTIAGVAVTKPANNAYFPALDGLRAIAFLMVFGNHYLHLPWGWTGVDVFFVLSGFLITGILFDTCDQPHRVRNFYIRRTLRIFPLYYGLMLLLVVAYPIFRWNWNWAWLLWPAYLGNFCRGVHPMTPSLHLLSDFQPLSRVYPNFLLRFGHFWSLCVEEQFYLIWPWVVFWVRDRRRLIYVCIAFVVICPMMRVVGSHTLPQFMLEQEVLYRWTPFRVDALLLGGLVALVRRGPSPRRLLMCARVVFVLLASAMVLWIALNPDARHKPSSYIYPSWLFTWALVFVDVFSACLIVMALERGSIVFRIFNLRPLRWMGRISYGAYVFHDIFHSQVEWFVEHYHLPHARAAISGLALTGTLLVSWASFRWFETPFIRLKDRWTRGTVEKKFVAGD